jgi:hypothetical protein
VSNTLIIEKRPVGRPKYALNIAHATWAAIALGRTMVRPMLLQQKPAPALLARNLAILASACARLDSVDHPLHVLYQDEPLFKAPVRIAAITGHTRAAVSAALIRCGIRKLAKRPSGPPAR